MKYEFKVGQVSVIATQIFDNPYRQVVANMKALINANWGNNLGYLVIDLCGFAIGKTTTFNETELLLKSWFGQQSSAINTTYT